MMKYWILTVVLYFAGGLGPYAALDLVLPDKVYQGDMVVGRATPGADVSVNGKAQFINDRGYFVIGVPRRQKTDLLVRSRLNDLKISKTIRVLAYQWKIQHIDGLPEHYVSPPPEALQQIKEDSRKIRAVRKITPLPEALFLSKGFIRPVQGRVTGVFGSQRILNAQPRNPHSGVDFAAPLGTPVSSPADGIVRLVAKGMYLMGNILMIDHGLGVQSIFIHLDSVLVKEGDEVRQGMTIARVGQTGRATGPHLHWGISVGTIPVDPVRLLRKNFLVP